MVRDLANAVPFKPAGDLVTGGSEGIGRALPARYLAAAKLTGRSAQKLETAQRDLADLKTLVNDGRREERETLARYIEAHMPELNVVINNVGIQRRVSLAADMAHGRSTRRKSIFSLPLPYTSTICSSA